MCRSLRLEVFVWGRDGVVVAMLDVVGWRELGLLLAAARARREVRFLGGILVLFSLVVVE